MKKSKYLLLMLSVLGLASCDDHVLEDFTWHSWEPGMVYCKNGDIQTYEECMEEGNEPEAILFHVDKNSPTEVIAYAVTLRNSIPASFSDPDTIYVSQGVSTDISQFNGESNTATLRYNQIKSPVANQIEPRYIMPSVAEMYRLYVARNVVNNTIGKCQGDSLPVNDHTCWYWTSTECAGAPTDRAWCFSLASGRFEAEDKHVEHMARPIMIIRLNMEEKN